jgi:hypothetical protein
MMRPTREHSFDMTVATAVGCGQCLNRVVIDVPAWSAFSREA